HYAQEMIRNGSANSAAAVSESKPQPHNPPPSTDRRIDFRSGQVTVLEKDQAEEEHDGRVEDAVEGDGADVLEILADRQRALVDERGADAEQFQPRKQGV